MLDGELKKQTDIGEKKQYQRLDKVSEFVKKEEPITKNEAILKKSVKKYNKSNLYYNSRFDFKNIEIFMNIIVHLLSQNTIVSCGFVINYLKI